MKIAGITEKRLVPCLMAVSVLVAMTVALPSPSAAQLGRFSIPCGTRT